MNAQTIPIEVLKGHFRVPTASFEVDFIQNDAAGFAAHITNISNSGVFIRTDAHFEMGQKLAFRFQLGETGPMLAVDGIVRWCAQSPKEAQTAKIPRGVGIQFVRLGPRARHHIQRYIHRFIAHMRS